MILTDDEALAEKAKYLTTQAKDDSIRYVHDEIGYNFRLTNIQAALGVAQLERIDSTIEKKQWIGEKYHKLLGNVNGIELPLPSIEYAKNIYWIFGIVLDDNVPCDANKIMKLLAEKNIATRPFFWSMHEQPVFKNLGLFNGESYPVSERISRRGFYIPSGVAISMKQIEIVSASIAEVMKKYT